MTWTKIWNSIYDLTKNVKPYLWPDQKFETLFMIWTLHQILFQTCFIIGSQVQTADELP